MKRIISFSSFVMLLISVIFISCAKESPVTINQEVTNTTPIKITPDNSARANPKYVGTISGILSPVPLKASVVAYNDHFQSEEFTANENGTFLVKNLPADGYHLLITYLPLNSPDYLTFEVYKVRVVAQQNTDVGIIFLPE
jgi:hypothetical protein